MWNENTKDKWEYQSTMYGFVHAFNNTMDINTLNDSYFIKQIKPEALTQSNQNTANGAALLGKLLDC